MSRKTAVLGGVLLCVFVLLFTVLCYRTPQITNYPTSGSTIVAFGDSLVEGVGTTAGHAFVDVLAERVHQPIINMGVSGETTADALRRIGQVLQEDPRVVIVLLGGNDALHRVPLEQTFANLAAMIETFQERGAAVLLVAPPGGIFYASSYEREFKRLADTYGVAYVPNVLKGLLGKPDLMWDAIHPNDAGHVIMADRIEPALRELLGQ